MRHDRLFVIALLNGVFAICCALGAVNYVKNPPVGSHAYSVKQAQFEAEEKARQTREEDVPDIAGEIAAGMRARGCDVAETGPREYTLKGCKE